jgi:hypothetical protein
MISITYNGETHTISQWAKLLGANRQVIYIRYRNGYTPKECLYGKQRKDTLYMTYRGETRPVAEWCRIMNVPYQLVVNRCRIGWSPEDCFKPNQVKRCPKIVYRGRSMTLRQWAEKLNISYNAILTRYHRGYTPEECLFGRKRTSYDGTLKILLTYNGETHGVYQWASILGVLTGTIYARYYKGWSDEECLFGRKKSL